MTYTNTSERNIFAFAIACVFSVSTFAFAGVAHAQFDGGSFDFQPMGGGSYDFQPMSGGSYDYQSLGGGSYDFQPMSGGSYNYQPLGGNTYDYQPLAGNTYDYQPLAGNTYDYQPLAGNTYDYQLLAGNTYTTPGYGSYYYPSYGYGYPYGYDSTLGYSALGFGLGYALGASITGYGHSPSYSYSTYVTPSYVAPSVTPAAPAYSSPSYYTSVSTVSNPTTITDTGNATYTNNGNTTNTSSYTSTSNTTLNYTSTVDSHNVTNVTSASGGTPQYTVQAYLPSSSGYSGYSYPSYSSYPYSNYYPSYYSYPYTYNAAPSCAITISNAANGQILLSWYSSNAASAYISPLVGAVSPSGSITLYPYGNSLYTMTVSGAGGSATCQTSNYYNAASYAGATTPAVSTVSTAAPYVALTQIPYTGYDFGPLGNALYWLGLVGFAVAVAYLVVYYLPVSLARKRSGAPALESVTIQDGSSETQNATNQSVVLGESYLGTRDSMSAVHSKDGSAPRIVITRT